jgi:hypothetical protein
MAVMLCIVLECVDRTDELTLVLSDSGSSAVVVVIEVTARWQWNGAVKFVNFYKLRRETVAGG